MDTTTDPSTLTPMFASASLCPAAVNASTAAAFRPRRQQPQLHRHHDGEGVGTPRGGLVGLERGASRPEE
jgi:hypothetical protein